MTDPITDTGLNKQAAHVISFLQEINYPIFRQRW